MLGQQEYVQELGVGCEMHISVLLSKEGKFRRESIQSLLYEPSIGHQGIVATETETGYYVLKGRIVSGHTVIIHKTYLRPLVYSLRFDDSADMVETVTEGFPEIGRVALGEILILKI